MFKITEKVTEAGDIDYSITNGKYTFENIASVAECFDAKGSHFESFVRLKGIKNKIDWKTKDKAVKNVMKYLKAKDLIDMLKNHHAITVEEIKQDAIEHMETTFSVIDDEQNCLKLLCE